MQSVCSRRLHELYLGLILLPEAARWATFIDTACPAAAAASCKLLLLRPSVPFSTHIQRRCPVFDVLFLSLAV